MNDLRQFLIFIILVVLGCATGEALVQKEWKIVGFLITIDLLCCLLYGITSAENAKEDL